MTASSPLARAVEDQIEDQPAIDAVVPVIDRAASALGTGTVRTMLRGAWLGHTLHPVMTDAPLGCWMSANLLDLVGGRRARPAAQRLVGLGLLTALPTVATGLSDFGEIETDRSRRAAAVHAIGNGVAIACFARSWSRRRRGRHLGGVAWGLAGSGVAAGAGFIGGHLSFARSVGTGERTSTASSRVAVQTSLPVG